MLLQRDSSSPTSALDEPAGAGAEAGSADLSRKRARVAGLAAAILMLLMPVALHPSEHAEVASFEHP